MFVYIQHVTVYAYTQGFFIVCLKSRESSIFLNIVRPKKKNDESATACYSSGTRLIYR